MEIIKNNGDTAIMFRCKDVDGIKLLNEAFRKIVPDYKQRLAGHSDLNSVIKDDENRDLINWIIPRLEEYGILATGWISKDNMREMSEKITEKYAEITSNDGNNDGMRPISVAQEMENLWHSYFSLPKEQRKGIAWDGSVLRPAEFDDRYLAQCQKEGREPDEAISKHFWKNCVDMQEYVPKYCQTVNRCK